MSRFARPITPSPVLQLISDLAATGDLDGVRALPEKDRLFGLRFLAINNKVDKIKVLLDIFQENASAFSQSPHGDLLNEAWRLGHQDVVKMLAPVLPGKTISLLHRLIEWGKDADMQKYLFSIIPQEDLTKFVSSRVRSWDREGGVEDLNINHARVLAMMLPEPMVGDAIDPALDFTPALQVAMFLGKPDLVDLFFHRSSTDFLLGDMKEWYRFMFTEMNMDQEDTSLSPDSKLIGLWNELYTRQQQSVITVPKNIDKHSTVW